MRKIEKPNPDAVPATDETPPAGSGAVFGPGETEDADEASGPAVRDRPGSADGPPASGVGGACAGVIAGVGADGSAPARALAGVAGPITVKSARRASGSGASWPTLASIGPVVRAVRCVTRAGNRGAASK